MPDERPNILMIMTDQQRGDALGIEGHPVLQTPQMDWIGTAGSRFSSAYTACPICVAARRTVLTGQKPSTHGVMSNYGTNLKAPTLPETLRAAGYQTHLSGKLHFWPLWKRYGFEGFDLSDGPGCTYWLEGHSSYIRFMEREAPEQVRAQSAHGVPGNGWPVRPWHLEERLHVANWATNKAMDFLETRDPTRPFFLNLSYFHPHPPITPPQVYYDRYMAMDLPEPVVGDWARIYDEPQRGTKPGGTMRLAIEPQQMKQFRAAYYAAINHIDDQINRVMELVPTENTVIIFMSDHGEMLGDHQWMHKQLPYEPSARIPFLLRLPKHLAKERGLTQGQVRDEPVELMDAMPTLLDAVGVDIPDSVEGSSVLPLLSGEENPPWRDYVHGEYYEVITLNSGMQYLTNGKRKYVWYPGMGKEEFFDLEEDPNEMNDLSAVADRADEVAQWRLALAVELEGRPEGFSDGKELKKLDGPAAAYMPGFEYEDETRMECRPRQF